MLKYILYYVAAQIALLITFIIVSKFTDKKYKHAQSLIPEGFLPTEEINIDPVSGEKTRVYYHPDTGERLYIEE